MAITTFIPKIWSARLLDALRKSQVAIGLCNRNYEGEITQMGDTVHINALNDITVKAYTKNQDIADPDELTTADTSLVIDQGDYYNFYVNDVDKVQARADLMDAAMTSAGYMLSDNADQYIFKIAATDEKANKTGLGTEEEPLYITADNAYETVVKMKVALDNKNVPRNGRYLVVPPEYEGMMLLDQRFASAEGAKAENRLETGLVARAVGFDIYVSNNLYKEAESDNYHIIASFRDAITYADQITQTEAYRREKGFDDGVKGLHVYGAKVTRPECVAVGTVTFKAKEGT